MSQAPFMVGEKAQIRLLAGSVAGEEARLSTISRNRAYYEGTQYDADNARFAAAERIGPDEHLPEHLRLHAYSVQIAECVDFIANQLTTGFQIVANTSVVQAVIDAAVDATDRLKNGVDEEIAMDDVLIDAGQTGDVPYEVIWDPSRTTCYLEFWPAEQVEFEVVSGSWVDKVTRTQTVARPYVDSAGRLSKRDVEERCEWTLENHLVDDAGTVVRECIKRTWIQGVDEPDEEWQGLPFIPWSLLRADKLGLRGFRGDPLITKKAIDNADRLNATEQHAFLIARYNSHGTLVVVGDQAFLQLEQDDDKVNKDVTDVLKFPGATSVSTVSLPTDPRMIQHTRAVCTDNIYASFGLVRVEPDTLEGIGGVSGYALEILNRKSEGKLRRVRRTFKNDVAQMCQMILDVTAYRRAATLPEVLADYYQSYPEVDVPQPDVTNWWDINPLEEFPDRALEVRMGTGYIVDDVQVRDDFVAGLISREEALRQRGYNDPDIDNIVAEIDAAKKKAVEMLPPRPPAPGAPPTSDRSVVKAGTTTGSTDRK